MAPPPNPHRHQRQTILKRTPRIGQYFWVDFPKDAFPPEFVEPHPGIIIRAAQALHGTCIIVPVTTKPQIETRHAHPLSRNPHPEYPTLQAWAVCNHLYTVHVARLRPIWNRQRQENVFPRVDQADMDAIYACIRYALPNVFPVTTTVITAITTETKVEVVEAG
jgi:uncharacterized protein YifN (PemK superfamily)